MVDTPQVVTNPSTNRARRSLTSLIWQMPLLLCQTSHQLCTVSTVQIRDAVWFVYNSKFYSPPYCCTIYSSSSSSSVTRSFPWSNTEFWKLVGGVAQWLGRRSLAGRLSQIYGWRVTTSWVRCPLWINQPGQLSLRGW